MVPHAMSDNEGNDAVEVVSAHITLTGTRGLFVLFAAMAWPSLFLIYVATLDLVYL